MLWCKRVPTKVITDRFLKPLTRKLYKSNTECSLPPKSCWDSEGSHFPLIIASLLAEALILPAIWLVSGTLYQTQNDLLPDFQFPLAGLLHSLRNNSHKDFWLQSRNSLLLFRCRAIKRHNNYGILLVGSSAVPGIKDCHFFLLGTVPEKPTNTRQKQKDMLSY